MSKRLYIYQIALFLLWVLGVHSLNAQIFNKETLSQSPTANTTEPTTYLVQENDTLYSIARRFKVQVTDLRSLNNLGDNTIKIGDTLILRAKKATPVSEAVFSHTNWTNTKNENVNTDVSGSYVIRDGDTLSSIAREKSISLDELKSYNDLDSDRLVVGQSLTLTAPRPQYHTVLQGESLYSISRKFNLSIKQLQDYNHLDSTNINEDDVLVLYPYLRAPQEKKLQQDTEIMNVSLTQPVAVKPILANGVYDKKQPSANFELLPEMSIPQEYKKAQILFEQFDDVVKDMPLLSQELKGYMIVLDPGHGGYDPGAIVASADGLGNPVYIVEDEYNYDIALRLYSLLVRHGAKVEMTIIKPNYTLRTTTNSSYTFQNEKNGVYNLVSLNESDSESARPIGGRKGLEKRSEVANYYFKDFPKEKRVFISIHADNNPHGAQGKLILYNSHSEMSKEAALVMLPYMGRNSFIRNNDELIVLKNEFSGLNLLIEVRNLYYQQNAWAIRNEELRNQDAEMIVTGLLKYAATLKK